MDDLCGNCVLIVLNIVEGRGFEFLQNSLFIEATLKTSKMQTDAFEPESNPSIYTELVWETEKREVRKLRSCHVPVRIDCFTVNENNDRFRIGFVLLNLRSARAISSKTNIFEEPKWYRLLGTPKEYKTFRPELAVTLTLKDQVEYDLAAVSLESCVRRKVELTNTQLIPLIYLDGGIIQIGNETDTHRSYIFKLIIRNTSNLDLLLNEKFVFAQNNDNYYFSINFFGIKVSGKDLCKNIHDEILINEEMFFKLYVNLDLLNLYFQDPAHFSIQFYCGENSLAYTQVDMQDFLFERHKINEYSYHKRVLNKFCLIENNTTPAGENDREPYVTLEVILQQTAPSAKSDLLSNSVSLESIQSEYLKLSTRGSGDKIEETIKSERKESEDITVPKSPTQVKPRSFLSVYNNGTENVKDLPSLELIENEFQNYHLYTLLITVRSITLRKPLESDEYLFKFRHPKADNTLTIHCDVNTDTLHKSILLDDIFCKLHFVSTINHIFSLLTLYPPLISLSSPRNNLKTEELHVYTQLLTAKDNDCNYVAILSNFLNKDDLLFDLDINLKYIDLGININDKPKQSDFDLSPYILDESFIIKTLDDWQDWRKQKENEFGKSIKTLQENLLEKLEEEWSKDRTELELKLKAGIEKCSALSEELKLATTDMKLRKMQVENNSFYNLSTIENIEMRVTQMLEEERNKDIAIIRQEKEFLQQKIKILEDEKHDLKSKLEGKEKELEKVNQSTLTKEQTTCLLQEVRCLEEKYFEALKEKSFFKEQWRKAAKEVHMLKEEKQQQIRLDIHKKKEELSQLSIESSDSQCDARENDYQNYEVLGYLEYFPGQFYSNAF